MLILAQTPSGDYFTGVGFLAVIFVIGFIIIGMRFTQLTNEQRRQNEHLSMIADSLDKFSGHLRKQNDNEHHV